MLNILNDLQLIKIFRHYFDRVNLKINKNVNIIAMHFKQITTIKENDYNTYK